MRKPKGYWKVFENIRDPLVRIITTTGEFPSRSKLIRLGHRGLVSAIYRYYGSLADVRERVIREAPVHIYTDGAYHSRHDGGVGAWAAVITKFGKHIDTISGTVVDAATPSRMELLAVIKALEHVTEHEVHIYTDNKNIVDATAGANLERWRRNSWLTSVGTSVSNQDLWERLVAHMSERVIHFHFVRGHAGNNLNEIAHAEASKALLRYADAVSEGQSESVFVHALLNEEGKAAWGAVIQSRRKIIHKYHARSEHDVYTATLEGICRVLDYVSSDHVVIYTGNEKVSSDIQALVELGQTPETNEENMSLWNRIAQHAKNKAVTCRCMNKEQIESSRFYREAEAQAFIGLQDEDERLSVSLGSLLKKVMG